MGEKTSMFELLKERSTEEEIIKITCDYDLKFCKLEEENKQLKSQLQQKENIIKEVREYVNTDKNCIPKHIKDYINNLLDKENK